MTDAEAKVLIEQVKTVARSEAKNTTSGCMQVSPAVVVSVDSLKARVRLTTSEEGEGEFDIPITTPQVVNAGDFVTIGYWGNLSSAILVSSSSYEGGGGSGGETDYNNLDNKPSINGVTLTGNKTSSQLNVYGPSNPPPYPVQSFNGRTGNIVPASGDYNASQITGLQSAISTNSDVAANTAKRHDPVTIGTANGLSLSGQQVSMALATTTTAGAMSSADKVKLNGVETGAQKNTVTSVNGKTGAVNLTAHDVSALPISGGVMAGNIDMDSYDVTNVTSLSFEEGGAFHSDGNNVRISGPGNQPAQLVNVATPTLPDSAANKAYADTKLPIAGGTITGNLNVDGNLYVDNDISTSGSTTLQDLLVNGSTTLSRTEVIGELQVDGSFHVLQDQEIILNGNRVQMVGDPEEDGDAVNKRYADTKVSRTGDTMTGTLEIDVPNDSSIPQLRLRRQNTPNSGIDLYAQYDGNGNQILMLLDEYQQDGAIIRNVMNPELDEDAVNKQYADTKVPASRTINGKPLTSDVTIGWTDIAGRPTSLPPSGTAGGDLSGTYPNPAVNLVAISDTRNTNSLPSALNSYKMRMEFKSNSTDGLSDGGSFHTVMSIKQWDNTSGGVPVQVAYTQNGRMFTRVSNSDMSAWGPWTNIADTGNAIPLSQKGVANGVASLNGAGVVPTAQLPVLDNINGNLSTLRLAEPAYVTGGVTLTGVPYFDILRADRTYFLPQDQIIIEQSTDAGATWQTANVSDDSKRSLFTGSRPQINIPLKNGVKSTDCMLRITITGMKYNVPAGTAEVDKYNYWNSSYVLSTERYCNLNRGWTWVNSNSDRIYMKSEYATGANPNTWGTVREAFLYCWSGGNFFTLDGGTFGGGTTQTTNIWNRRFTFRTCSSTNTFNDADLSTTYQNAVQSIYDLKLTGPQVWVAPNRLMYNDHLYSWDINKNAFFPGNVHGGVLVSSTPTGNPPLVVASTTKVANLNADKLDDQEGTYYLNRANHTGTQLAGTISDFVASVRTTALVGLSTVTNAVITAGDTVLTAFGKLQAQITAHISNKNNPHEVKPDQIGALPTAGGEVTGTLTFNRMETGANAKIVLSDAQPELTFEPDGASRAIYLGTSAKPLYRMQVNSSIVEMQGARVQGVGTPTANTDAANKQYVDSRPIPLFAGATSTAAATVTKEVSIAGFTSANLVDGQEIFVNFINRNTALNPLLNVSGVGAKAIASQDGTMLGSSSMGPDILKGLVSFVYYAGAWRISNFRPATTTEWGVVKFATTAEAVAGTDNTKAMTPSTTKSAANAAIDLALVSKLSLTGGDMSGDINMHTKSVLDAGTFSGENLSIDRITSYDTFGSINFDKQINMNDNHITGVPDPLDDDNAVNMKYANTKLSKNTSDTMTGTLTIEGPSDTSEPQLRLRRQGTQNSGIDLYAQYDSSGYQVLMLLDEYQQDGAIIRNVMTPQSESDAVNKQYVDDIVGNIAALLNAL